MGWEQRGWRWVIATAVGAVLGVGAVQAFQPTGPAVNLGSMPVRSFVASFVLVGESAKSAPGVTDVGKMLFEVPQAQMFLVQGMNVLSQNNLPFYAELWACLTIDEVIVSCENCNQPGHRVGGQRSWSPAIRAPAGAKVGVRILGNPGVNASYPPVITPYQSDIAVVLSGTLVRP